MEVWADSATVESLGFAVQNLTVAVDSLRAVAEHLGSIASDSTHPLMVREIVSKPTRFVAIVTHPGFTFVWSALVGVIAFAAGRIYEYWNDRSRKNDNKWTSARLTRRYLLLARDQIRALIKRFGGGNIAEAHVDFVLRTIGDFEEIKARMISLEDDEVEEAIFQWNLVASDDLLEARDRLTMPPDDYVKKYAITGPLAARDAASSASLEMDAGKADEVIAMLEPYLKLRKAKRK